MNTPSLWLVPMLCAAALVGGVCCGKASVRGPTPALAQSLEAQRSFEPIQHAWRVASPSARVALAPRIQTFRVRFHSDPLARVANVYLAFIALEKNDLVTARSLATAVRGGPAGNINDNATVVYAAVLARGNRPEQALELLDPLLGKMLDDYARGLLHMTGVSASMAAKRWYRAIVYMNEWLHVSGEQDVPILARRFASLLEQFPSEELESIWYTVDQAYRHDIWKRELKTLLAMQLAHIATERGDTKLAQSLIKSSRAIATSGKTGVALAQLATFGGRSARVIDARIGWLVDTRGELTAGRSSQAIAGALQVLPPSGGELKAKDGVAATQPVLITQSFGSNEALSSAIDELVYQGASILIGGYDAATAAELSKYAEANAIAVVLLTEPAAQVTNARFTFVLGAQEPTWQQGTGKLPGPASAQVDPAKDVRIALGAVPEELLSELSVACPADTLPQATHVFAVQAWKKKAVRAIAVDADPACAKLLLHELAEVRYAPKVYLGLEARQAVTEPRANVHLASSGYLDLPAGQQLQSMQQWLVATGAPPTWFEALGRDAAMLARHAVEALPEQTTIEKRQVVALRTVVQQRLATNQARLWTSRQTGFAGGNQIRRTIQFIPKQ